MCRRKDRIKRKKRGHVSDAAEGERGWGDGKRKKNSLSDHQLPSLPIIISRTGQYDTRPAALPHDFNRDRISQQFFLHRACDGEFILEPLALAKQDGDRRVHDLWDKPRRDVASLLDGGRPSRGGRRGSGLLLLAAIVHLLDLDHLLLLPRRDGLLSAPGCAGDLLLRLLLLCSAPSSWWEGLVGGWRRREGEDVCCAGEEDRGALWVDIVGELVVLERGLGRAWDGYGRGFGLSAAGTGSSGRGEGEGSEIGQFQRPFSGFHRSMGVAWAW